MPHQPGLQGCERGGVAPQGVDGWFPATARLRAILTSRYSSDCRRGRVSSWVRQTNVGRDGPYSKCEGLVYQGEPWEETAELTMEKAAKKQFAISLWHICSKHVCGGWSMRCELPQNLCKFPAIPIWITFMRCWCAWLGQKLSHHWRIRSRLQGSPLRALPQIKSCIRLPQKHAHLICCPSVSLNIFSRFGHSMSTYHVHPQCSSLQETHARFRSFDLTLPSNKTIMEGF